MKLKGYDSFVNEFNITSLKNVSQGGLSRDPVLKKDFEIAQKVFSDDTFMGSFRHNDDDEFYVAYDDNAPHMDRVKKLMDAANSKMKKLHLEIDKSARENPSTFTDDDRLDQILFMLKATLKN